MAMDKKTNQSNPTIPEKPPMPPTSSYPTIKESVEGYLTEKEQRQLMLDEEALRETLEEEAKAQKELEERNKTLEEEASKEQAHDELFSATDYVNANGGIVGGCLGDIKKFLNKRKLDQVVAIVKSCSPNVIGYLTVTMKDLSGTIPETIHYKVIGEGGYGNDIIVGVASIIANVSVFSPKPSMHYLNITKRNVVKVFRKDTVPESRSGSG
uniref:Homologous recombination OB-fold protein OB-fold domain-containing protein n=1 Tax=Tanacetum cinerariifolium TaxID=118510 RepID=A0A6L2KY51_TANCI|nr:hypothetical protein [Tanacetum cinerariifolium]